MSLKGFPNVWASCTALQKSLAFWETVFWNEYYNSIYIAVVQYYNLLL